jgi:hypothetical protein
MKRSILLFLFRRLASSFGAEFHSNVSLARSFEQLEEEGLTIKGHGFIFPNHDAVSGIYLVDYTNDIMENKYGRYN